MKHALCIALLLLTSCDGFVTGMRGAGLLDQAPPAPKTVDIICDYGGGSSGCTPDSLRDVLSLVTPTLPPGSIIRLQPLTDDVSDAKELARYEITAAKKRTRHAIMAHHARETEAVITSFLAAARPIFTSTDRHASPIAEAIATALLAGTPIGTHHIIVLTDGRQVSARSPSLGHLDFECGAIPTNFAQRLNRLFGIPLNGVAIHFAYVKLEPVENNRCDATVERYEAIKHTWTTSLAQLGAKVTWSMGPIKNL